MKLFLLLFHSFFRILTGLLIRFKDDFPFKAVHHSSHTAVQRIQIKGHTDKCRNIHHTCQNSRMGIGRTMNRYKSKDLVFIHLHCFTGVQVICHYDGRFGRIQIDVFLSLQVLYQAVGNILDICRPCLHIIIIHTCKHFREIVPCHSNCIFCVYHFCTDHVMYGIEIILILQHHLMYFKNSSTGFSNLFDSFII